MSEEFKSHAEINLTASRRSAFALMVLVFVEVISFSAFLNHLPGSWFNVRIGKATESYYQMVEYLKQGEIDEKKWKHYVIPKENIGEYAKLYDLRTLELVWEDIVVLSRIRRENWTVVKVPIFGIAFDLNDLGLFSGFAFLVVLMWYRFSLYKELHSLEQAVIVAKKVTKDEERAKLLTLLALQQALIPSARDTKQVFWRFAPRGLVAIPAVMYFFIVGYDVLSWRIAWEFSPIGMVLGYVFRVAFMVLIVLITWQCFAFFWKIDRIWTKSG